MKEDKDNFPLSVIRCRLSPYLVRLFQEQRQGASRTKTLHASQTVLEGDFMTTFHTTLQPLYSLSNAA